MRFPKTISSWMNQHVTKRSPSLSRRQEELSIPVECLEVRMVLAANLTVIDGVAGSGSLDVSLGTADGTLTAAEVTADLGAGTISSGALASVGAAVNIDISSPGSIDFDDLTATLTLQTGAGNSATFTAATAITFANSANAVATSGGGLALVASTGIGTLEAPFGSSVPNLEAQTVTGGIFIDNSGDLNIGGVNATLTGVRATTGGNIVLTNAGSILAVTLGDTIQSANGNVTLTATGATADVSIATGDSLAISALGAGSTVFITAGQDLFLGNAGGKQADVNATNVTLSAGRDITLNADSDVLTAGGTLTATAGGNISLLQTGGPGASLSGNGPAINVTTGAGGVFTLDSGAGGTVANTINFPVNIAADDVVLVAPATISGGTGVVTIRPVTAGRAVDLGTNTAGQLGLTDSELDLVTAGVIRVGNASSGNITITASIDTANTNQLELVTGGAIGDGAGAALTETRLGLTAATGIGTLDNFINAAVSNLEATTATGGIFVSNTGDLDIGGVSAGLTGVRVTGTSGDISLISAGTISIVTNGQKVTGPGDTTVTATGATSDVHTGGANVRAINAEGTVMVSADRDIIVGFNAFGDIDGGGSVVLNAGRNITLQNVSFVFAAGVGTVTANAGLTTTGNISVNSGRIGSDSGTIDLTTSAGGEFTLSAGAAVESDRNSIGADITISADDISIGGEIEAGSGIVTLQPITAGHDIDLGTETVGDLSLTDAELNQITASVLRIGGSTTGNINVTAPVSLGVAVPTLSLISGSGAIIDGTGTEQTDLTVTNLSLKAFLGIGAAADGDLDVAVTNLAFNNGNGNVVISNSGALTIAAVDQLATSNNNGADTNLTASSPVTFAVDTSSAGTLTVNSTDSADAGDDITINAGVTITSTGDDVVLNSGDTVVMTDTSTISATNGTIFINLDGFNASHVDTGAEFTSLGTYDTPTLIINSNDAVDTINLVSNDGVTNDVQINTFGGEDTINVTPSDVPITVDGGTPTGTFPGDSLFYNAQGGFVTVTGFGEGTITNQFGLATVTFSEIENLLPQVGTVALTPDPLNPGEKVLTVQGTDANDTIVFESRVHGNVIRVKLNGVIIGNFDRDDVGRIVTFAGAGNDRVTVYKKISKNTELFGEEGNDTLTSGAGADELFGGEGDDKLSSDGGNDLLFGGDGNDQLFGQKGHDVLLGGDGDDLLNGGKNRDVLIGGDGVDKLVGDGGEDILIGGTTDHDANELALKSILAEWASANTYLTRIDNISTGNGLSVGVSLKVGIDATVFDDGDVDQLFGGSSMDWFFNFADLLKDKTTTETVT